MQYPEFFTQATGNRPYPYQTTFATASALPHILEVPTGTGKTATAVLGWLWRRIHAPQPIRTDTGRRLIFCLPMRSLVEQTHRVCGHWLNNLGLSSDVRLHVLMGGAIARNWDDEPDRDAIILGTQDQLLSRALNRGYSMSRFRWPIPFGWLNNDCLWVMDEVQLMGSGLSTSAQLHALRAKFGTVGPTHTVWMSATLAAGSLDTIDLRGIEKRVQGLNTEDRKALRIRLEAQKPIQQLEVDLKKPAVTAKQILGLHAKDSLTLVVVNRVSRARALAQALGKLGAPVELIHSRFRPHERKVAESKALKPGWNGILVATQAIEAGVDIDARVLVTELASWPSLVQRFGRCNRAGKLEDAQVLWMDVPSKDAAPYTSEQLDLARGRLAELEDVGPESLAKLGTDDARPALPVLRRTDLFALFDTQADLAGHDIDVSGFVRAAENDDDLQIFWRTWEGEQPPNDSPAPHRDELCRVPAWLLKSLIGKDVVWRWSSLRRTWTAVRAWEVHAGLTLLLPTSMGGYSTDLGWTGDKHDIPEPVELPPNSEPLDYDEGDPWTHAVHHYVELSTHSSDVVEAIEALHEHLSDLELPWAALGRAARWHDLGKVHPVFQAMLTEKLEPDDALRDGRVWAKSDGEHAGTYTRKHFRHELASALAFMQRGGDDLEVYLVAAHHGKVRMAIRSRPTEPPPTQDGEVLRDRLFALGVWDGDELPSADLGGGVTWQAHPLDLSPMKLGRQGDQPSWTEHSLGLLDEHGPFRLAYLEALLRIADWRATRKRLGGNHDA